MTAISEDSAEFGNCSWRKHSEPAAAALMIVASVDGRAIDVAVAAAAASVAAAAAEGNEAAEGTRSGN